LAVGGWRLAVGGWRLAVGGWRLAVGGWRLAKVYFLKFLSQSFFFAFDVTAN